MLRFGRTEGYPVPPSCLVTVCALSGPNTEEYFKYEVPIVGVVSHTKEIAIIRFLKTLATTNTLGTIVYSSNIQKIPPDIYHFISVTISEQPSIRLDDADATLHIGKCIHIYYILTMYREEKCL